MPASNGPPRVQIVKTVAQIESAIEKLGPAELSQLVAWMEERRLIEASAAGIFQIYDEEETLCRSRVAEKSG